MIILSQPGLLNVYNLQKRELLGDHKKEKGVGKHLSYIFLQIC